MPDMKKAVKHSTSNSSFNSDDVSNINDDYCHPAIPGLIVALCYVNYGFIIVIGHLRDALGKLLQRSRYAANRPIPGYAPLFKSWENFYTRRLYHRIQDCWNRPIAGPPGAHIDMVCRESNDGMKTLVLTSEHKKVINLGSYNYLGFADDWGTSCKDEVLPVLDNFPISCCTNLIDYGKTAVHKDLEDLLARFLCKDDAIVFNMGFGCNLTSIPALAGKGTLILSDTLNHMSIVMGCRASGAHTRVFKHNDAADLEEVLREAIIMGMPRTRRPWKKIIILVEGIYSMEGEICNLRGIVDVAKKYKAYTYLDEAHSIGALGTTGRGACEYCGVDPADVDVMMGTFTKSFGGIGGYVAGTKSLINHLRRRSASSIYYNSLSPLVAQQVCTALKIIMGENGTDLGTKKLSALRNNANYVRRRLISMGFHVFGHFDSPIVPVMLYQPAKIAAFSRECLKRGVAVVVVGFPATSLLMGRSRICISAAHTREDLHEALKVVEEVGKKCLLRYANNGLGI